MSHFVSVCFFCVYIPPPHVFFHSPGEFFGVFESRFRFYVCKSRWNPIRSSCLGSIFAIPVVGRRVVYKILIWLSKMVLFSLNIDFFVSLRTRLRVTPHYVDRFFWQDTFFLDGSVLCILTCVVFVVDSTSILVFPTSLVIRFTRSRRVLDFLTRLILFPGVFNAYSKAPPSQACFISFHHFLFGSSNRETVVYVYLRYVL